MKNSTGKSPWRMMAFLFVMMIASLRGEGQNNNATWTGGTSGTGTNWSSGSSWSTFFYPGSFGSASSNTNIATFTSAGTGDPIGMNLNVTGNGLNIGAIVVDNTRSTALNITNSSTSSNNGLLRFYGATVNSVSAVILRNNSTGLLTIKPTTSPFEIRLASTQNVIIIDNSGGITINTRMTNFSGTQALTKAGSGSGVLTLTAANPYLGNTNITAGTLALADTASIPSSPQIIISSGATFSISGLSSALSLGALQSLRSSATGSNTTATLVVASGKNLSLSASGLVFTGYGGGSTAPLTVSGASAGALELNAAPITVTTTSELAAGTYTLVAKGGAATGVTGTPGSLTVNGSGLAAGNTGSLSVSDGQLILTVTPPYTTSTLTTTAAGTITGTSAVSGGNISDDGGAAVTRRGLIYSTGTITDTTNTTGGGKLIDASGGTGSFTSSLTGLNPNTTYYIRAFAVNAAGVAYGSSLSFSTADIVPNAPTAVSAAAGNGSALVTFSAPASNGGSAVTSYTVTSNPGGITASGSGSPINVTGLTNATAYTFTVTASNAAGTGAASDPSNSAKPASLPSTPQVVIGAGKGAICAGASVAFTAFAYKTGGGTVTYQWKLNGNNVGTNSDSFSSTSLVNGDVITCEISIGSGAYLTSYTATSNAITMTVTQ